MCSWCARRGSCLLPLPSRPWALGGPLPWRFAGTLGPGWLWKLVTLGPCSSSSREWAWRFSAGTPHPFRGPPLRRRYCSRPLNLGGPRCDCALFHVRLGFWNVGTQQAVNDPRHLSTSHDIICRGLDLTYFNALFSITITTLIFIICASAVLCLSP